MMQRTIKLLLVVTMTVAILDSCRKVESVPLDFSKSSFFEKSYVVSGGKITQDPQAFVNPPSKEMDEAWVDKAITELKKLDVKDNYVTRMQAVGQPIWNQSLVFLGGDGIRTIITPLYDKSAKVNGAAFSFFEKDGKFNARILSKQVANKYFSQNIRNIKQVGRATLNRLFEFFQTGKNDAENIQQVNTNTVGTLDDPRYYVYTVCFYVPVYAVAPSTVVFERQCHSQVFYGTYSEWDYYYGLGTWIDPSFGYYETYDENTVQEAQQNQWQLEEIDTIGIVDNDCFMRVLRKLMRGNTSLGKMAANVFQSPTDPLHTHDLSFVLQPMDSMIAGQTKSRSYANSSVMYINSDILNTCSDLFVANTIIHEMCHAFMAQTLFAYGKTDSIARLSMDSCMHMWYDLMYELSGDMNAAWLNNGSEHEYMVGWMINWIADALAEFDDHNRSGEYYWNLAWCGLEDTRPWKWYEQHPMSSDEEKNHNGMYQFPQWQWRYALTPTRMAAINSIIYSEKRHTGTAANYPVHDWNNCY